MMPRMDGFEMLRAIRARRDWRDLPVVIITSKDLSQEETAWRRGNAEKLFLKGGYSRKELVETLRAMLRERIERPSA